MNRFLTIVALFFCTTYVIAQGTSVSDLAGQDNVITTSVPFLTITPDARSAGMGDVGAATDADANSMYWNPAKMPFAKKRNGFSLSATPWLQQLVSDVWIYNLAGYAKVKDAKGKYTNVIGASIKYFSLGDIQFTDFQGANIGNYNPNEWSFDASLSKQLSDRFSLGIALRFILSDLAKGQFVGTGQDISSGVAGAADLGAFWKDDVEVGAKDWTYQLGAHISNVGSKLTYTNEADRDFIPTNLRLGTTWKTDLDQYNSISLSADVNKLLVPTPQVVYELDSNGNEVATDKRERPDVPVMSGIFQSFTDAPGGFREEMNEWIWSLGIEYWYDDLLALRVGYFNEAKTKGNRKYATFGVGIRYNVFGLDIAYLQPFTRNHPLQNTIRFTMHIDFEAFGSFNKVQTEGK